MWMNGFLFAVLLGVSGVCAYKIFRDYKAGRPLHVYWVLGGVVAFACSWRIGFP